MSTYDDMHEDSVAKILAGIKRAYSEARDGKAEKPPTDKVIVEVLTRNGKTSPDFVSRATYFRIKKEDPRIQDELDYSKKMFTPYQDPDIVVEDKRCYTTIIAEHRAAIAVLVTRIEQLQRDLASATGGIPDDLSGLDEL